MKTPFEILDVPVEADDEEIKSAYLQAVKRWPPEKYPEQFQRVRRAYEKIATHRDRHAFMLFDISLPEPADLLESMMELRGDGSRPPVEGRLRDIVKQSAMAAARDFEI